MPAIELGEIRRILVLNRNHIGDCLLTTPMLRALKRRFPRAEMHVAIPAANRDLLSANPHVDEIVERPRVQGWGGKIRFAFDIRKRQYDLILSLQEKSLFYHQATWFAGFWRSHRPVTVALDHPRSRGWYRHNIVPLRPDQHEVFKYLDVAAALGCPVERNPVLELCPPAAARERAERLLRSEGIDPETRFLALNPGGTKPEKRWPTERFARVGDRLREELGLPVLILGGPGDRDRASAIAERMRHRPLVAAGRASLGDTAALLERCELLVTGDTGPMHMAVALAVPVVALFGPTNPVKFAPFTTLRMVLRHERPCRRCELPCLHTITPEECAEAALRLCTAPPASRVELDRR